MKAPAIDLDPSTVAILAVVAVGGFLIWRASSAVGDALSAVPEAIEDGYEFLRANDGIVPVVGDVFGVPRTDAEKCAAARRDGRTLDASLYCPATDFFRYLWS